MGSLTNATNRPDVRAEDLVRVLRGRILSGKLAPGAQVATRAEIGQEFGASTMTVQRALEKLRRDGYVRVHGRRGTFVSEQPPHLARCALVFQTSPTVPGWVRFFTALADEAVGMHRINGREVSVFYGAGSPESTAEKRRLEADVEAHRVGGVIFAAYPYQFQGSPILEMPGMPRVVISKSGGEFNLPSVGPDADAFMATAVDALAAQGCRRLGCILPARTDWGPKLAALAAARDLTMKPYWCQEVGLDAPAATRSLVHLLMNPDQAVRPDGLIICDDNLVEHAAAGLVAAGVKVPEDVRVIAHANFPNSNPLILPFQRLGFDARRILAACGELIERQQRGEAGEMAMTIEPQFETELEAPDFDLAEGLRESAYY